MMNAPMTHGSSTSSNPTSPTTPLRFDAPGPGSWVLDAAHCERPVPCFMEGIFEASFGRGLRDGLEQYGALLETIEGRTVNGYVYTAARPYGAPPDAGAPPKIIVQLLTRLHPGMRARVRKSATVFEQKPWREDVRRYDREWTPPLLARHAEHRKHDLRALDDDALLDELEARYALCMEAYFLHHRMNCSRMVPVGDFLVHLGDWLPELPRREGLEALRGSSPDSVSALDGAERLARLVHEDPELHAGLENCLDPKSFIDALEAREDAIGEAARAWLAEIGHRVTGFSLGYPTLRELPSSLVESLRGAGKARPDDPHNAADAKAAELRERLPAELRPEFDVLLAEARSVAHIRDHSCLWMLELFGTLREALFEVGRRLVERGRILEAEHALDLRETEVRPTFAGGGPPAEALAARTRHRLRSVVDEAPPHLGPAPQPPPPAEWLPAKARRLARALDVYVQGMFGEQPDPPPKSASSQSAELCIRGRSASAGRRRGRARLVLGLEDFERVREGDVLIARMTTPAYNVLLPLLAGIVTDRGGILSHPAIVSREYGIPGVVGTRVATRDIPDGAEVEIDGDAGEVRVLS